MKDLYTEWGNSMDSFYEEKFYEPIVKEFCQYGPGGSVDKREARGRTFHAGYEMYIYAFFLGLYIGKRTPLDKKDHKRAFRMPMNSWGYTNQRDREPYPDIQKFIFAALVAKTDLNMIDLDREDKDENMISEAVKELMRTLCEYANTGFYTISKKMMDAPDYFRNEENFFNLIMKYARG